METKQLTNTDIVNCKQYLMNSIESELQKGIPISVIDMIVKGISFDLDSMLQQVLLREAEQQTLNEEAAEYENIKLKDK